jgi:hypothetical protein
MMSTTILALALGDDHLILNGGAWQILSGQNIYFQLLLVLKEINFILHIKYSTILFIFCYSQVGPDYFFLWNNGQNFYFQTFRARIFIYKIHQPPPLRIKWSSLYGIVNVCTKQLEGRREGRIDFFVSEGRIRIFCLSTLKGP